jgi:hypothetical protein
MRTGKRRRHAANKANKTLLRNLSRSSYRITSKLGPVAPSTTVKKFRSIITPDFQGGRVEIK